jgi:ribonuclease HI
LKEKEIMNKIFIYTDGGSRGNPGPSALGVYIEDENGKNLASIGKRLGETTNNIAEYSAILEAFIWLLGNKDMFSKETKIYFFMDSLLAYSQITGFYGIKNLKLKELLLQIHQKEAELGLSISYAHIRRENNKKADRLVNLALDNLI